MTYNKAANLLALKGNKRSNKDVIIKFSVTQNQEYYVNTIHKVLK